MHGTRAIVVSLFLTTWPVLAGAPMFTALDRIDRVSGEEAGVQTLAFADIDGDSIVDMVSADGDNEEVSLFRGVGDGTFGAPELIGEIDLPTAVVIADLTSPFVSGGDVDGNLDVVVGDDIGGLQIFIGHGDGTFDPPDQSFDDLDTVEIAGLAAADFDGDGRDDVAILESFDGVYFLCNEQGTMQPCPTAVVFLDEFSFELADIDVGDFDGAGDLDVAVVDRETGDLFVVQGAGDGTFDEEIVPLSIGADVISPRALRVGRIDGDDIDDIAVVSFDFDTEVSTLTVFNGSASGLTNRADYPAGTFGDALVLNDLDRDGDLDAIVVGQEELVATGDAVLLLGDGQGGFGAPAGTAVAALAGGRGVEAVDLDGDGDSDLVGVVEAGTQLQVLLNEAAVAPVCVGDCNGNGTVAISELVRGVNIALGRAAVGECTAMDRNGNGAVAISELVAAVSNLLSGCSV